MADVMYPSLTRSKVVTVNWQGNNTPISNKPYYFGYDLDIKGGLTTGVTICMKEVNPFTIEYYLYETGLDITTNDAKYGYITLVNIKGERLIDSLPLNTLFIGNYYPNDTPGLVTKNFCVEIDPAKSFVVFNYQPGDLSVNFPSSINFEWYYRKRIK